MYLQARVNVNYIKKQNLIHDATSLAKIRNNYYFFRLLQDDS